MPTLVVGPNWVGDMIMAHSLITYIKSKRASDPLHVLRPPGVLMLRGGWLKSIRWLNCLSATVSCI